MTNKILSENWVLGEKSNSLDSVKYLHKLRQDVLQLYLKEYIKKWDSFLNNLRVKPFINQEQMIELVNIISGKNFTVSSAGK